MSIARTPTIVRHRRDSAETWTAVNPVLHDGQLGYETDTSKWKWGDGETAWNDLPYAAVGVGLTGDLGDLDDVDTTGAAAGDRLVYDGAEWVPEAATLTYQLAASDLTTDLEDGTNNAYFRAPRGFTLTEVRASLLTASSSGVVTVDINKNGTTMLSTKLTIDATEKTSETATTPAVISVSSVADDDEITVDIDEEGTGARGLIVTLIGTPV
jgi:hypothetical protein